MHYYSTRNFHTIENLSGVILNGLAPDGGLYLPNKIPALDTSFWKTAGDMFYQDILFTVLTTLIEGDDYDRELLKSELNQVFDFSPELIAVSPNKYLLDLNQGPTSAFKDFGANTLGAFMRVITKNTEHKKIVLVATSGDTGSAVANAMKDYSDSPSINVIVLYPKGRVSDDQRRLMTTVSGNITCLEVDGNFDDCQKLVKDAMLDDSIRSKLTSANSINLIRLYGQIAYYIYATSRIGLDKKIIFSVPSGNLGNLTAGYFSKLMGNPIQKFIVSHNANDMFHEFILAGSLKDAHSSIQTISSAMDVYKPSNLERLIVLFGGEFETNGQIKTMPDIAKMQEEFYVQGFDDEQTKVKMKEIFTQYNIQIDPHTAVGLLGIDHAITTEHPEYADHTIVTLSTAHPSKFNDIYTQVIGHESDISTPIIKARQKPEYITKISNDYTELYEVIVSIK
jgi:threonine synthase